MCISKGRYGEGEPKNIIFTSVERAHKPIRAGKVRSFMQLRIWAIMEIYVNSGLPIATVPWLHQSNVHIKRKLWGRRAQKYNPCVGAKSPQICTGRENTRFYAAPYMGNNGKLRKFRATYHHGTVFAPKQCEYQRVVSRASRIFLYNLIGIVEPARAITVHVTWHMNTHGNI